MTIVLTLKEARRLEKAIESKIIAYQHTLITPAVVSAYENFTTAVEAHNQRLMETVEVISTLNEIRFDIRRKISKAHNTPLSDSLALGQLSCMNDLISREAELTAFTSSLNGMVRQKPIDPGAMNTQKARHKTASDILNGSDSAAKTSVSSDTFSFPAIFEKTSMAVNELQRKKLAELRQISDKLGAANASITICLPYTPDGKEEPLLKKEGLI